METSDYLESLRKDLKENKADDSGDANALLEVASDDHKLGKLIATLRDENASVDARRGASDVLRAVAMFSPFLPKKNPEYVNALRGLMDDEDPVLRKQAFADLAVMKDAVAQARLRDELMSPKREEDRAIESHYAIALLGHDEKALDTDLLRAVVMSPPTEASLVEAVRHMPSDDDVLATILVGIMEDDTKPLAARQLIPAKVSNANPSQFLKAAQRMIRQKGLGDEFAPYLLSGVGAIENKKAPAEVAETREMLRSAIKNAPASLHSAAEKLFEDDE